MGACLRISGRRSVGKSNPVPAWQYNEFRMVGRDYGHPDEAAIYDRTHADFRDIEAESRMALKLADVEEGMTLLDFGCGTGTLAVIAATQCREVHAVDVSEAMLEVARKKAQAAGVGNVHFHHAGFLTYEHKGEPLDVVMSTFAFHHLPDFWKGIALKKIHDLLKPGGRFYLRDVILEDEGALENIRAFIDEQERKGGDFLREDAEGHFREKFSTYDWVIEGLLERAGFRVGYKSAEGGVVMTYVCNRVEGK